MLGAEMTSQPVLPAASAAGRLRELAERALAPLGLEVVHLQYQREGGRWCVRLYVDRDGGVTLDDCGRASEQFDALLEASDIIPHRYVLEVSSPGIDRPLFKEADYIRFAGRQARLTTHAPIAGQRHFSGRITACVGGEVSLLLEDGQLQVLALDTIASGRLEVDIDAQTGQARERGQE